jgi:hypothetical protein
VSEPSPQIYAFDDFAAYLAAYVAHRQRRQAWFSVRRLTKRAGFGSPAQLSMLINRQRVPTLAVVERVCAAIGLTPAETAFAVLLTERQLNRSKVLTAIVERELQAMRPDET